ncbi:MAG: glycoside hydrolase family 99-like domain-containing protein [Clostridia bacterium]|nr:glycoside hydrolase family 99-like domain-containing protein [Clostridia bacterium]
MKKYDIAAYIWPSYTGTEPRTRIFWDEGIGEWQTVRKAAEDDPERALPVWGFEDEADPKVMEKQIDAAADHGVNVFIYDWYWYDHRPFLEQCLDNGFLKAKNRSRMKFYLMWANHDVGMVWDRRNADADGLIYLGAVDRKDFDIIVKRVIENYFSQPEYYKIDGKPVFMIYEVMNLIKGLGGVENAREALDYFRAETVKAGFPGLELQMTFWSEYAVNLSGVDSEKTGSASDAVRLLGFDSITHYQFVHFTPLGESRPYKDAVDLLDSEWAGITAKCSATYYPHVSVGWDNNPRYKNAGRTIMTGATPELFGEALEKAKKYVDDRPEMTPLITINSWNEWTETSYLEPDTKFGYAYLETVKKVFGDK